MVGKTDLLPEGLRVIKGSEEYIRFIVHPIEYDSFLKKLENIANLSNQIIVDEQDDWVALPTSSMRTLFVLNKKSGEHFIAKTSINSLLAGVNRDIWEDSTILAEEVTKIYDDLMIKEQKASSDGLAQALIPNTDGKTVTFLSERNAMGVKGMEGGRTILRTLPKDYGTHTYLPFFSLMATREDGTRWIDEVFESYSSIYHQDKLSFFWNEIAKPLVEFNAVAHLKYGLITEMHQQNVMLRIDPKTKKILGIAVKDMDGHSIDFQIRQARKLKVPPLSVENSARYGFMFAHDLPNLGFQYFKDSIFKHLAPLFLGEDKKSLDQLIGLANERHRNLFNKYMKEIIFSQEEFNDSYVNKLMPKVSANGRDLNSLKELIYKDLYAENFLDIKDTSLPKLFTALSAHGEEKVIDDARKKFQEDDSGLMRFLKDRVIFPYYDAKERYFEKSELPRFHQNKTRIAEDFNQDEIKDLLKKIENQARGFVPDNALDHWLHLQRFPYASFYDKIPMSEADQKTLEKMQNHMRSYSPVDSLESFSMKSINEKIERLLSSRDQKISAYEMDELSQAFAEVSERQLEHAGKLSPGPKSTFLNEAKMVAELYNTQLPHWYSFDSHDIPTFNKLMALPINVAGLTTKEIHVDGGVMGPVAFRDHDHLHSLAIMAGMDEYLKKNKIEIGSAQFYQYVLERITFSKQFQNYVNGLKDEKMKRILNVLWFDAFHDYFPKKWPIYKQHENYPMTMEALRDYLKIHINPATGKMRTLRWLQSKVFKNLPVPKRFGGTFARFTPGDFWNEKWGEVSNKEIEDSLKSLNNFSNQVSEQSKIIQPSLAKYPTCLLILREFFTF